MDNIINCERCNKPMRLDDVDFNFERNYDNYYICDNCNVCAIEKIRYGRTFDIEWFYDE